MGVLKNSAESNYDLAMALFTGTGGRYDTCQAFNLFIKGARHGHPKSVAMCEIMKVLSTGDSGVVDRDVIESAMKAGISGTHSEWILGKIHEFGLNGTKSSADALRLYEASARKGSCLGLYEMRSCGDNLERAAEAGFIPAIKQLADSFVSKGDAQSLSHALELYLDGAERGSFECMAAAAWLRIAGMDDRSIPMDSESLLEQSAQSGCVEGQLLLGMIYRYGISVPISYERAMYWFLCASDGGSLEARCQLGIMYELGLGLEQSYAMARYFYENSGTDLAQCRLGMMYEKGESVEQSMDKAISMYESNGLDALAQCRLGMMYKDKSFRYDTSAINHFEKAAEAGNPEAMYRLARIYAGRLQTRRRAFDLCSKAAKCCLPEAEHMMAEFYLKGIVVRKDRDRAIEWLERAKIHGHPEVGEELERLTSERFFDRLF